VGTAVGSRYGPEEENRSGGLTRCSCLAPALDDAERVEQLSADGLPGEVEQGVSVVAARLDPGKDAERNL